MTRLQKKKFVSHKNYNNIHKSVVGAVVAHYTSL
jgi:hypothetical protein